MNYRHIVAFFLALAWSVGIEAQPGQEQLFALDAGTSRIYRFDPTTATPSPSYPTPILCQPEGACGLAYDGRVLYYVDATDPAGRIYILNPADGTIWHSLPTPTALVDGLALVDGSLWALSLGDDTLYKLDTYDGTVLDSLVVAEDLVGGLGGGQGRLFASRIRPARVFEIDPSDGSIVNQFDTPSTLPAGLAMWGGGLFVSDLERQLLFRLDPDSGVEEAQFAPPLGKVAALASGVEQGGDPPYALRLEEGGEVALADGRLGVLVRAEMVDEEGRPLSTNDQSRIDFALVEGEAEFGSGAGVLVEDGRAEVVLDIFQGQNARVEARASGLEPVQLDVGGVNPTARLDLSLLESDRQVVATVQLFDFFDGLSVLDTNTVVFAVARGAAVVVGPTGVPPQSGRAATTLQLMPQAGTVLVAARSGDLEDFDSLSVESLDEPEVGGGGLVIGAPPPDLEPPPPPTNVRANQQEDGAVAVNWALSPESGLPYWVFRSRDGGLYQEIGRTRDDERQFVDVGVEMGAIYRYKILAFDGSNLSELLIVEGSAADVQRTVGVGVALVPVDAQGRPVQGLFGSDLKVEFDDFFLFADQFGRRQGQANFDPTFDLDQDGEVGFGDFFIFADNFGRQAVGFAAP